METKEDRTCGVRSFFIVYGPPLYNVHNPNCAK